MNGREKGEREGEGERIKEREREREKLKLGKQVGERERERMVFSEPHHRKQRKVMGKRSRVMELSVKLLFAPLELPATER